MKNAKFLNSVMDIVFRWEFSITIMAMHFYELPFYLIKLDYKQESLVNPHGIKEALQKQKIKFWRKRYVITDRKYT